MADATYTKPDLRERIKDRIMAGGDGGKLAKATAEKRKAVAKGEQSASHGLNKKD